MKKKTANHHVLHNLVDWIYFTDFLSILSEWLIGEKCSSAKNKICIGIYIHRRVCIFNIHPRLKMSSHPVSITQRVTNTNLFTDSVLFTGIGLRNSIYYITFLELLLFSKTYRGINKLHIF